MALEISEIGVRLAVGPSEREAGEAPPAGGSMAAASREAIVEAAVQQTLSQLRSEEDR
jgi:hypothetical protein